MTERSRRVTTFIFLLSIFVFLGVITFVWSYRFYQTGKTQTANLSKSAVECGGYVYRVVDDTMSYENKTLRFKIEYVGEGSDKFKRLSVFVNGSRTLSQETNALIRSPTIIIKDIEVKDEFLISPEGCEFNNIKNCSLSTKKCVAV